MKTRSKKYYNIKTKKVKKYYSKTKKKYHKGGSLDNLRKNMKTIRAKGRRGSRAEPDAVLALAEKLKDPKISSFYFARKNPTARYDVEKAWSPELPGNFSIKSVARKSPNQKKYQICTGDACNFFSSFLDTEDPLFMSIIIRYEDQIDQHNRNIPLHTNTYDLTDYKNKLFGNLSNSDIKLYIKRLRSLDQESKHKTFYIVKTNPGLSNEKRAAYIDKAVESINKSLNKINDQIAAAGGKLHVRLSKGNYTKGRYPRILSHFSHDPESPRIKRASRPQWNPDMTSMKKSSSSDYADNGAEAFAGVAGPAVSSVPGSFFQPVHQAPTPRFHKDSIFERYVQRVPGMPENPYSQRLSSMSYLPPHQ